MMKSIARVLLPLLTLIFSVSAGAASFQNETLHYTITYKWGLIHKDAAKATLHLSNAGSNYRFTLTARTLPWADKFYMVRDTLISTATKSGLKVVSYSKISHEKGEYKRDDLHFSHGGSTVKATSKLLRPGEKNGPNKITTKTLLGAQPAYDMLSVFYYLRQLDYDKMNKNTKYVVRIFSGSKVEDLNIQCLGEQNLKMRNKTTRQAYKFLLSFTMKGKKKSSEPITAYISADPQHIPLYIVGKLPIGEVRVYLD